MLQADEIAELRKKKSEEQATKNTHRESIEAVTDSGRGVVDATKGLAKGADIDKLIAQVKEVQLASLLGASKPSIVLTDQTDLGDKMEALGERVADAIKGLEKTDVDSKKLDALKQVANSLDAFSKVIQKDGSDQLKASREVLAAIKKLDMSPVVNVPETNVTVQAPSVDMKPLQASIERYWKPPEDKLDLACYRAQDLITTGDMQYVGFVNAEGNWYIIENDVKQNRMRYLFGTKGYEKAFKKAPTYEYRLLNEAVNAL